MSDHDTSRDAEFDGAKAVVRCVGLSERLQGRSKADNEIAIECNLDGFAGTRPNGWDCAIKNHGGEVGWVSHYYTM